MKKRAEKTAKKGSSIPGKGDSFSEEAQKVFPKQRMKGLNEPEEGIQNDYELTQLYEESLRDIQKERPSRERSFK